MQEKLIQYLIPTICVVLLAFTSALGGAAWGWSRGVTKEQGKLAKERAALVKREKDMDRAAAEWTGMVDAESAKLKQATADLAAARVMIDQLGEFSRVEVRKVATDGRCISPAAARLLRAGIDKANARLAAARDPGVLVAAATTPSPTPETLGEEQHLALPEWLTEREIAEHLATITADYELGATMHNRLVDKLRASPLIKVVPDNSRSL